MQEKTLGQLAEFDKPASAITPGQAAVFYDTDQNIIAGGWINKIFE